jgi:hypothetical protein
MRTKCAKAWWLGLLTTVSLTPAAWAQIPAAPAAPTGAAVPTATTAPAAAPAAPSQNLWSFLCLTPQQKANCQAAFCNCSFGQLLSSSLAPAAALTGGMISPTCDSNLPNAADLAKPSDSAQGAAARIKADEANAKARREAVRYLGTVSCHYWPEAEKAIILSLRGDRNECVRLEAAWALTRGCCCTARTVAALAITVSGSERDGFPAETSERVRAAAYGALDHCLAALAPTELVLEPPAPAGGPKGKGPIEKGPREGKTDKVGALSGEAYYDAVAKLPMPQVADFARRTLATLETRDTAVVAHRATSSGLMGLVTHAFTPARSSTVLPPDAVATAAPPVVQLPAAAPVMAVQAMTVQQPDSGGLAGAIDHAFDPAPSAASSPYASPAPAAPVSPTAYTAPAAANGQQSLPPGVAIQGVYLEGDPRPGQAMVYPDSPAHWR